MTRFSIAMATYNGARHLREQLDSLARQTLKPVELVVGDDGSTDATLDILEQFSATAPFPVIVTRNPANLGYGQNFMTTAARCSGDWIAFCDQDDIWDSDKLADCARWIAEGPPDLRLIVHDAIVLDEDDGAAPRRLYGYPGPRMFAPLERIPTWFCAGFSQVFSADLVRVLSIEPREGGLLFADEDRSLDRKAHDTWIPLLANVVGTTLVRPEPLVRYRRHDATVTTLLNRVGMADRIGNRLRGNGKLFVNLGGWYGAAASALADQAVRTSNPDFRERLYIAIAALRDYQDGLMARSALYSQGPLVPLLRSWLTLVRNRRYWGGRWPFGMKGMIKDLVHILTMRGPQPQDRP